MPTCVNHPYQEAQHRCPDCGQGYCGACVVEFLGQRICGPCRDRRLQLLTGPGADAPLAGTDIVDIGGWLAGGWALIQPDLLTWMLATLVGGLISVISCNLCLGAVQVGFFMMAYRKMTTGYVDLGNLFDGFRRFGSSLLFMLLQSLAGGALVAVVALPASVLEAVVGSESTAYLVATMVVFGVLTVGLQAAQAATFFALPHLAARNVNAVEAIAVSLEVFRRNWFMFMLLTFVWGLVMASGTLVCFVGVFLTTPVVMAATAKAYADHFGIAGWDAG